MKSLNILNSIRLASVGLFGFISSGYAEEVKVCVNHVCPVATVDILIKAIKESNDPTDEPNTIILQAGTYSFTEVNNESTETGANSLPLIARTFTIEGAGELQTTLKISANSRAFYILSNGFLKLHNLEITGGGHSGSGGVIYNAGKLEVDHVSISKGYVSEYGGGIYNRGQLFISHSKIFGNKANCGGGISNGGAPVGGVYDSGGILTISDTVIENNELEDGDCSGGGIYNNGDVTLLNSRISGNGMIASGSGGGIFNTGSMNVLNTSIADNSQQFGGGVMNSGQLTLESSTLSDGHAFIGGAVNNEGTLTLINSTISGNNAKWGSGIFNHGGAVSLFNSTLTQNKDCPDCATGNDIGFEDVSGGIANKIPHDSKNQFTIQNSIISGNITNDKVGGNCGGTPMISKGRNLDSDGSCNLGSALIDNPLLGPLQDNGGSTKTHALLTGSPAIDSGDDTFCPHRDQRGAIRPQNGHNSGSARCDIGAYEVGLLELEKVQINGDAKKIGRVLRLTPDIQSKAGSAFLPKPFALSANTAFHSHFTFQIGGVRTNNGQTDNDNGSDGFAFLLQNDPRGAASIGNSGEGLGFGINQTNGSPVTPISPSVAIEFDTFPAPFSDDPDGNHVGLIINGQVDQHNATFSPSFFLNNGDSRYVWIDYVGITKRLDVYINTIDIKPTAPAISKTLDLAATIGTKTFIGFTAGTGARFNSHDILAWELDVAPDLNGDSCVDKADLTSLLLVINGPNPKSLVYDLNGDGKVNIADSRKLVNLFSKPLGAACSR